MKIQPEDLNEFDIETVLRYGRSGLVEGIEPIFFDRLEDYIDDLIHEEEQMDSGDILIVILVIIGLVLVVTVGPLFTIASINTLFGMTISYNFWTWLSAFWVNLLVAGGLKNQTKGK